MTKMEANTEVAAIVAPITFQLMRRTQHPVGFWITESLYTSTFFGAEIEE
jgi:hypothetical protein